MVRRKNVIAIAATIACAIPAVGAWAQASTEATSSLKMRSRLMTSLTGYEVQEYLKRNDVIFIPVGPSEVNGNRPLDSEYVVPLAYAIKLAEKADGLVFPNISYIDPGSTNSHNSTVQSSAREGIAYITTLTRSLIRQGFRRIVFITSHGPASHTVVPAQDEIFYETHVSSVWIEPGLISGRGPGAAQAGPPAPRTPTELAAMAADRAATTYGAYKIVGRLEDMPVGITEPPRQFERDQGLEKLAKILGGVWNGKVPAFFADGSQHGGFVTPVTTEQRDSWGTQGASRIEREVAAFDINGLLDALREHNAFTARLAKRLGSTLPGADTSINRER